jgi:hypothetical protein
MIPKECKRLAEVDFPIAEVSRQAAQQRPAAGHTRAHETEPRIEEPQASTRLELPEVTKMEHHWHEAKAMRGAMRHTKTERRKTGTAHHETAR